MPDVYVSSYPFLHTARDLGVSYGLVLSYADYLEKTFRGDALSPSHWETRAASVLTRFSQKRIKETWEREHNRRTWASSH